MKKKILSLALSALSLGMYAKTPEPGKVDPLIENKFRNDHGQTIKVSWDVVEDVNVATFEENGETKQVYYSSDGNELAFGRFIRASQLPTAVEQSIARRFGPIDVLTVYELKTPESPTRYLVRFVNRKHQLLVWADEFGRTGILEKIRNKTGD